MTDSKKQYRIVGLTVFIISIMLLILRIVSYYIQVAMIDSTMDEAWLNMLFELAFSVPAQVLLLFLFPFLMYKFAMKKTVKEVFAFSGYHKCNVFAILLSILIGLLVPFMSMGLSVFWQMILILFGYIPSGSTVLPSEFSPSYFLLSVLITAILPAICEEFANRGGLLTVMRGFHSEKKTILLIAIAFGLFHQNITQIFYTAILGALLAYLVLETGSILPAVIVHFMNNFVSVYLESASEYGWAIGGGFYDFIDGASFGTISGSIALVFLAVFGLALAVRAVCKNKKDNFYLKESSAFAAMRQRPKFKDNIFYIGAIIVTITSTFITYLFGL